MGLPRKSAISARTGLYLRRANENGSGPKRGSGANLIHQTPDQVLNAISNPSELIWLHVAWIREVPVLLAGGGKKPTIIPTAHGDHNVVRIVGDLFDGLGPMLR